MQNFGRGMWRRVGDFERNSCSGYYTDRKEK